ncbi:MAG: GNAT family N-acetyltransferase, partial [Endomicrobiaceae bacterium]|nr:GNAT family N-acetyltransferase [Endomicrobiaceae bacterium]
SIKDAKEILDLQKTAFESEAELYGNYSIEPLNQSIEEIKQQFSNYIFLKAVSSSDGSIVGTVRAFERDGTCYIGKLAVSPKMQNNGIATLIMKEIEKYFKCKRFELFTGIKSEKNIYLYKKLGYSVFKKEQKGCGGIEIVYMEKTVK